MLRSSSMCEICVSDTTQHFSTVHVDADLYWPNHQIAGRKQERLDRTIREYLNKTRD